MSIPLFPALIEKFKFYSIELFAKCNEIDYLKNSKIKLL